MIRQNKHFLVENLQRFIICHTFCHFFNKACDYLVYLQCPQFLKCLSLELHNIYLYNTLTDDHQSVPVLYIERRDIKKK